MEKINIDELLAKTKEIATELETKSHSYVDRKNVNMLFLSSIEGEYEIKVFLDKNASIKESLDFHSIPTPGKKTTVVCSGADCPICKRVAKLTDLGYETWRMKGYKQFKIFLKTGKVKQTSNDDLQSDTVYLAYVNKAFLKGLIDAINSLTEYEESKVAIAKMYDPESTSGGFVVKASHSGRSMSFNFNFISGLNIDGINIKDTFGSEEAMDLAESGYFRKSYIDETKVAACTQYLDSVLVDIQENPSKYEDLKKVAEEDEEVEETSEATESTTTEIPAKDIQVESDTPTQLECFGKDFNPQDEKCKACTSKKACVMKYNGIE